MKKNLKLLVVGLLVAVAATLACAFTPACGGGNNGTAYTIKVVCAEEGFDYTQITAQWCATDKNNEIGACYGLPKALDANGEATWETLPDDFINNQKGWHAQINLLALEAQGYSYDKASQSLYVTAPGTVTITLTKTN